MIEPLCLIMNIILFDKGYAKPAQNSQCYSYLKNGDANFLKQITIHSH